MSDSYITKVGIYIGDFNPFHKGYTEVVTEALERGMNQVWVIPVMDCSVPVDERFWIAHYELEPIKEARVLAVITDPDPTSGKYHKVEQLKKVIRGYGSRLYEFWIIGEKTERIEEWEEGGWILGNFKVLETDKEVGEKGAMCSKSVKYIKSHELYCS